MPHRRKLVGNMHPALKRFIEQAESALADLQEPERTIRAAKLHNEMLRRFKPEMFTGEEELDGNPIEDEPITDKDVEDGKQHPVSVPAPRPCASVAGLKLVLL